MARLMSVNDIMNRVVAEIGLSQTTDPVASTDETFVLVQALLDSAGAEMVELHPWQTLVREYNILTQEGDTGEYDLPDDFSYMIDQTGWDKANNLPMNGPLSAQEWTYLNGRDLVNNTIYASFRQAKGKMLLYPQPPPDGVPITFEYISRNWLQDATNSNIRRDVIENGGDICLYEPILIIKFLKIKLLDSKGFDSTAARQDFENMFISRTGKDEGARVLSAAGRYRGLPYLDAFRNTPDTNYGPY